MKQSSQSLQHAIGSSFGSRTHPWFLALAFAALVGSQIEVAAVENDPAIESETKATYVFRYMLRENPLEAKSRDGIVTLTGMVDHESERQLAQATASGVDGVKGVENRIEVRKALDEHSDTWLYLKLKSTLAYHRSVGAAGTRIEMNDGVATLTGEAVSEAQRELISEYAIDVEGVRGVRNELTLASNPRMTQLDVDMVDDASATAQVRMALATHRSTGKLAPTFTAISGVVTLSGASGNQGEPALVEKIVQDINGIRKVVNHMTIPPASQAGN